MTMNESLQRWREEFGRDSDTAFDQLARGLVPLGAASQLSFGEILDKLFEPGDAALDSSAANWLERRILGIVPEDMSLRRWVSALEEYFRGIATMELPETRKLLCRQHKRIRLWLHGFYEGSDRDPEGAYLLALTRAQDDQRFSPLWRRLILGEELPGRSYLGIGILGFRKMPEQDGHEASDVPEGLLQALVMLADKPGTNEAKWKQTMCSLFATYRRSEKYWVGHLAPLLPHYSESSCARDWLSALLPGISDWRPTDAVIETFARRFRPVPRSVRESWVERIAQNPALCDSPEFADLLNQYRAYARTTGDPEYLNKTFNNLSTTIVHADRGRSALAVSLMEEAMEWAPWNPHNWTSYAQALSAANREADAINTLWDARQHFAFNSVIRNELGRLLRESGDLVAAEDVYREAVSHFPSNTVCRTSLADLLIDLDEMDEAERLFREVLAIDAREPFSRGGLARVLSIRSARTQNTELRDEAKRMLQELAEEGDRDAQIRLQNLDEQWERATTDPTMRFRAKTRTHSPQIQARSGRVISEMSVAERLGRAMIALWQAERAEDIALRSSLCANATALLEIPEGQINEELIAAFVETRGLILLASGDAQAALAYFDTQIRQYGRGAWIGIRLGERRTRALLGNPEDTEENVELLGSNSARFALYVAQVMQILSASPQETAVLLLLKSLYPKAVEFAAQGDSQTIESGAKMMGAFLQARWFQPAGIQSQDDLDRPEVLHAVVEHINSTRTDAFDVISNATLALAA